MLPVVFSGAEGAAAFDLSTVMQSAVTNVQSELFAVLAIVVPSIALVLGAVTAVKFGIKWLKQLGKV